VVYTGHPSYNLVGRGVTRYDGAEFVTFTTEDGLADNCATSILSEDREGNLWFGTAGGGVSRYDGETFLTFTTKDGMAHNKVQCMLEDQAGHRWFGTRGGGVSRYEGKEFVTFTTDDGLADDHVLSIFQDREGHLWLGTFPEELRDGRLSLLSRSGAICGSSKDGTAEIGRTFPLP